MHVDLLHCSHRWIGKCTYIPTAVSVTILAAPVIITFLSQAEKNPNPSERTANFIYYTIITSASIIRITTVGMTLMIRPPIVVMRTLWYMPHRERSTVKVNTEYPKHETAKGIACRKHSLSALQVQLLALTETSTLVHSCHKMVAVEEMAPRCSEGDKETGSGTERLPHISNLLFWSYSFFS